MRTASGARPSVNHRVAAANGRCLDSALTRRLPSKFPAQALDCDERIQVIASVAQPVEHRFRKPEVKGSSPFAGSIFQRFLLLGQLFGQLFNLDSLFYRSFPELQALFSLRRDPASGSPRFVAHTVQSSSN